MNENTETQTNNTETQSNNPETKTSNDMKSRLISMLVLAVSIGVAAPVLIALIVGQTLFSLFASEANDAMKNLAKQLTDYIYDALNYLSVNSDVRPFPYQDWNEKEDKVAPTSEEVEQAV